MLRGEILGPLARTFTMTASTLSNWTACQYGIPYPDSAIDTDFSRNYLPLAF
jgi:hypothetical protein